MRDRGRFLCVLLGMLLIAGIAARPAPAIAQSEAIAEICRVEHHLAGTTLRMSRRVDGTGEAQAYIGLDVIHGIEQELSPYWTGSGAADHGTLSIRADLPSGTTRTDLARLRFRLRGGGRMMALPVPTPAVTGQTREVSVILAWDAVDRAFAGVDTVDLVLLDGGRERLAGKVRLDRLRAAIAVLPQLREALTTLLADPVANCRRSDPESWESSSNHAYDCSDDWTTPLGDFAVDASSLSWHRALGDHVAITLTHYPYYRTDRDFARLGLPPVGDPYPSFAIDFGEGQDYPETPGAANYAGGSRRERTGGEVRVGAVSYRQFFVTGSRITVPWAEWRRLMAGQGEVTLSAFDAERGVLVSKTLPHDFLVPVEAELMAGQARMDARERHPLTRCELSWSIVTRSSRPMIGISRD